MYSIRGMGRGDDAEAADGPGGGENGAKMGYKAA